MNVRILCCIIASALLFAGCVQPSRVQFTPSADKIDIALDGKFITSYRFDDSLTKPVLYPIQTPANVVLTRGFPFEKIEGETTDHPHHIGLFFTYDKVNGIGFWNNTTKPPMIKHQKVISSESRRGQAKLVTQSDWVAKDGSTVFLVEDRTMVFKPIENGYSMDLTLDLTAKTRIEFGDTKEGMFAIRTADWLSEKIGKSRYFSSEGTETSKNIWGKRAKWVALEGKKDDKPVGIAILNHPASVNYPTYWHARDYGLFSANPLGQEEFQKSNKEPDPKPFGLILEPGKTARFRFLVLIYDGNKSPDQINDLFAAFAK